jgi:hypothetical protein
MMNEIGLAQRRLMDDDPSTAGQQLPYTGTLCSTASVQSAPFPTIPSSHPYQIGPQSGSENLPYTLAPNGTHMAGNSSSLANRREIYDLTPIDAANQMDTFSNGVPSQPLMGNNSSDLNPHQDTLQPRSQQTGPYSPHDTEPMSSVTSMRLSGPKTDTAGTSLISPQQSQTSAYDELALPAAPPIAPPPVVVEPPTAKKKRGRPKKQSLPDDDEDDELANSRDHEFRTPGPNGAIDPSDSKEATENDTPVSSGVSDETDEDNLEAVAQPGNSEAKASKKKRTKQAKATPTSNSVPSEDGVIWIDTKPIGVESVNQNTYPNTESEIPKNDPGSVIVDSNPQNHPQPAQTSAPAVAIEEKPQSTNEKPAPKKRGRKRKQPAEQEETTTTKDTPKPKNISTDAQTPGSKLAVVVDNSPKSAEFNGQDEAPVIIEEQSKDLIPAPADEPLPPTSAPEPPQTPSKPDTASVNTPQNAGKGPNKHSPISARGGVPYRVGLSKRARIAPLLKMVRK